MTVRDCITNNIPIWRLKHEGWRLKWTKNNISNKIKNEVWYMINGEIHKSDITDFKVDGDRFVWFKNVINEPGYKESMDDRIDERETVKCLFKFYHLLQ